MAPGSPHCRTCGPESARHCHQAIAACRWFPHPRAIGYPCSSNLTAWKFGPEVAPTRMAPPPAKGSQHRRGHDARDPVHATAATRILQAALVRSIASPLTAITALLSQPNERGEVLASPRRPSAAAAPTHSRPATSPPPDARLLSIIFLSRSRGAASATLPPASPRAPLARRHQEPRNRSASSAKRLTLNVPFSAEIRQTGANRLIVPRTIRAPRRQPHETRTAARPWVAPPRNPA